MHRVQRVSLGEETAFREGHLTVRADEAVELLAAPSLADVRVTWVSPGDSARVVKVLDAVEPRTKGPGGGGIFPGFLSPGRPQGRGTTHVLSGAAVVSAGFLPRAQEAVLDLLGPAAAMSPLAATHNLVVEFTPAAAATWEDVDRDLRVGVLRLAARLAETALDAPPDVVEDLPVPDPRDGALPRVGAVVNIQTQGAFKDVFVHGRSLSGGLPTLIDPGDLDDGAVVSGQYGHPALKNPTYLHQNNPVVEALRRRSGTDLVFAGVVLSPEPVDQEQKQRISAYAARLCALAGFDAAVLTKEGGGNADADVAMKMDELEELGLTAVGLFSELAGADGTGPSIVVPPTKATAMVSTGNYDERLVLPAVERALGGDRLDLLDVPATEELELPMAVIYCALSPIGWGRLTCREAA